MISYILYYFKIKNEYSLFYIVFANKANKQLVVIQYSIRFKKIKKALFCKTANVRQSFFSKKIELIHKEFESIIDLYIVKK